MGKRDQITCRCLAIPYPHRQGGGDCEMPGACPCFDATMYDPVSTCSYECQEFENQNCPHFDFDAPLGYDPRSEALTVQERNPNFRSW